MENLFDELNRLYSDAHKKQLSEQQAEKEKFEKANKFKYKLLMDYMINKAKNAAICGKRTFTLTYDDINSIFGDKITNGEYTIISESIIKQLTDMGFHYTSDEFITFTWDDNPIIEQLNIEYENAKDKDPLSENNKENILRQKYSADIFTIITYLIDDAHLAAKSKNTIFCLTDKNFNTLCPDMPYEDRRYVASLITKDLAKMGFYHKPSSSFDAFYNYSWKPFS